MTRQWTTTASQFFTCFAAGILSCAVATPAKTAQDAQQNTVPAAAPASIQEQLASMYRVAKLGKDSGGYAMTDEGTLLDVQKGGILGTPYGSTKSCPSKYVNGQLQQASSVCTKGREQAVRKGFGALGRHLPGVAAENISDSNMSTDTHFFQKGDKVYPTKIDVDAARDRVAFSVVACDKCNNTNPPTYNKSEVDFQFDKKVFDSGDVSTIEDTIGQVFSLDNSSDAQGGGQDQGQAQGQNQTQSQTPDPSDQGQAQVPAAPAAQPAAQAEPQTVQLGQTTDQVEAILGKPNTIVDLGAKKKWVYKDLKITFMNGKVTDVE